MSTTVTEDEIISELTVTPYYDGKKLRVDGESMNAGLSVISMKGYDVDNPNDREIIGQRNSYRSIHRPEISKLKWTTNCSIQQIEQYFAAYALSTNNTIKMKDLPPPPSKETNELIQIHFTSKEEAETDEDEFTVSKINTIKLSDHDLCDHTALHKCNADFCVTIGNSELCSSISLTDKNNLSNLCL